MKNFQLCILFLLLSITLFSNDQYIYSQVTKDNLVMSDQYNIDGFDLDGENSVLSIETEDINLNEFLNSVITYDKTPFIQVENNRYEYMGMPRFMVKFDLEKNTGAPKEANFNLTEVDESGDIPVYRRLIDESYMISGPLTNFIHMDLEESKNTFVYEDEYKLEHLIAYKYQEVVYRLYIGIKNEGIRPIKKIEIGNNLENFYSENDYIDFVFENNGTVQMIEKGGITGKFIDGKFELMGLENGESYNLDLYTLRYRNNNSTGNYVVVTYESSLAFNGQNQGSIQGEKGWLEDIDISNYKNIELNVLTVTTNDLLELKLKDISEKRGTFVNTIPEIVIESPISLSGTTINIGETNYNIIDNQIVVGLTEYQVIDDKLIVDGIEYLVVNNEVIIDNILYQVVDNKIIIDEKKYIYRWTGSYDSSFIEEKGEQRTVSFNIEGVGILLNNEQVGIYIEPSPVERDERYPHQRLLFETKDSSGNLINYELKDQKYQMVDRILTPARLGYRQIKSIDYDLTLGNFLLGEGYTNINQFKFENNNWKYLVDENVEGLMIEKTISEAAVELLGENGDEIKFYTDDTGNGLTKIEEGGDKVVYNWNEGPTNTNGVILNYDKVIFRIIKMPEDRTIMEEVDYTVGENTYTAELPIYYWNPYINNNPINYLDSEKMINIGGEEKSEGSLKMESFLFGDINNSYNENYIDLVMDAGSDKEMTFSNAVISYEAANKNMRLIGLPVGEYMIQLYTVKRGHDGTYKVITYENSDTFLMDIPEIASEEFDKENNIHKIDFITTGTSSGNIQVNVNFITKMEREVDLTLENFQSVGLPTFKMSEKNEGTGEVVGIGDLGQINLKESNQKRFLFPLDVVFVIDNSGSMQNEIDAVKNGLTAFGQELYDRGFDVKYNLITFGPAQNSNTIRNWSTKVDQYLNYRNGRGYMAIYKDEWFDGSTLGGVTLENRKEKEKDELIDAFDNIRASSGYYGGQENSAWGLHYAIEKIRANGRYLDYSGEITENSSDGYMPSQKMIIFLTDENMDDDYLPSGYNRNNVLRKLYSKLNATYNGLADNINLTGLFHVRKRGNSANGASRQLTRYEEDGVPGLGYKYSWGRNRNYWEEWDDRETPIVGIDPSDRGDIYHTDFKYYNTGNNFFMYEMGSRGEHVGNALQNAISNIGIIQRWELSYLTPFNEYDGTTRTVDFKLIGVRGKDGTLISKTIRDLDEYEDKQYAVQEEKLVVEFEDPTGTAPKLSVIDGKGVITFLAKSRYHELNSSGETIIIEDVIKGRSLNVLKTDGTLLFGRTTDDITMSLSGDGWSPLKITESNLETILENRSESWVGVENLPIGTDPVKDILSYIDKAKYRIDGSNNYEMWLKKSEVDRLLNNDLGINPSIPYFNLVIDGSPVRIDEEYFKNLMGDRSDTWYELKNSTTDPNLFSGISGDDFEKLDGTRYRIRLGDLDLKELLDSTTGEDVELKISKTKLEAIGGDSTNFKDFGQQGWYEFNIVLTESEMQILRDAELNGSTIEYINLEGTAVTDLFSQTKILEDVLIDVTPPKVVEISVINQTLRNFLKSMKTIGEATVFTDAEAENYSGYAVTNISELGDILNNIGSYVKIGDLLDIVVVIEDKNLTEDDIFIGVDELGWVKPFITDESTLDVDRFKLSWKRVKVGKLGTIGIGNAIEDRFGNRADQNFSILNIDMTDIVPSRTITDGTDPIKSDLSDGKYYINSNYNIDLGGVGNLYRAGIIAFEYDKTKADLDSNNNYYGDSTYYHNSPNGLYTGGIKEAEFEVAIDSANHKSDGEYVGKIYGMSRSGKLINISDYSDDDFDIILDTNYTDAPLSQTTIVIDTVGPQMKDILIAKISEDDQNYYFNISFKMEDFNASYQILDGNNKGGYSLNVEGNTNILSENLDGEAIVYEIKVNKGSSPITTVTLIVEDKAGNRTSKIIPIEIPKDIEVEIYENVYDWENITTQRPGDNDLSLGSYKFTKGGHGSLVSDPVVYAIVPTDKSGDTEGEKIKELKIEKFNLVQQVIQTKVLDLSGKTGNIELKFDFVKDGINIVKVTPINVYGIEGEAKELKFIVDTKINTSYLQGGIIGSLTGGKINIDLSSLEELAGIDGYNYSFIIGGKVVKQDGEDNLNGSSFTTIQNGSITNSNIEIDTSLFTGGSRGDLKITVWDRLGHEKVFEKAYFIPTKSLGIKATIEEEVKRRESKLKIIGEGTNDKFELENSIDKSSE